MARPDDHTPFGVETVNDKDAYISNVWRSIQADPEAVATYADWPVNEADLHARHKWLVNRAAFRKKMVEDPDYYDPKVAGWWIWGQSCWIGCGWCAVGSGYDDMNKRPLLLDMGVHKRSQQVPKIASTGTGVHRSKLSAKRPHLSSFQGVQGDTGSALMEYMQALANRLRRVRVCCGDWSRICGPSPTVMLGVTGVFLDPPYGEGANRQSKIYSQDSLTVAGEVRKWAIEHGDDKRFRIALCGYEGEHKMPAEWECMAWKAQGGFGNQGKGKGWKDQGQINKHRERIWFSPHCLKMWWEGRY